MEIKKFQSLFIIIIVISFVPLIAKVKMEKIKIKSANFEHNAFIPSKFTCDGENISPELSWSDFPKATKSFVLIADDPDAPMGTWVHWVVYNIPKNINHLQEAIPKTKHFKNLTQGITDFRSIGYGGPCPPSGVHRYFFKIYALDIELNEKPGLSKNEILKKIKSHIIGYGELIGKYQRKR